MQQIDEKRVFVLRVARYFSLPTLYVSSFVSKKEQHIAPNKNVWSFAKNKGGHMMDVFEFEDSNQSYELYQTLELNSSAIVKMFFTSLFKL